MRPVINLWTEPLNTQCGLPALFPSHTSFKNAHLYVLALVIFSPDPNDTSAPVWKEVKKRSARTKACRINASTGVQTEEGIFVSLWSEESIKI